MIVAIDGPAGSGKSTVAHAVAERCHLTYLDTGAMYRSVAAECLHRGIDPEDGVGAAEVARTCTISFGTDGSRQTVSVDGRDVTDEIRTPGIDRAVSPVSAVPAVREAMVALQRKVGEVGGVVAEGRDIGTVVFPGAEVKVFLTADATARAHRRAVQREGGDAAKDVSAVTDVAEEQSILEDLKRRDEYDSNRAVSPLRPADDAVRIDSSSLTVEEVVARIVSLSPELKKMAGAPSRLERPSEKVAADQAAEVRADDGVTKRERGSKPEGKLHAFGGNSFDDYYDSALNDHPLPARMLMGFVVWVLIIVSKIFWPWKIEDAEKLLTPGGDRGRMLIMNHTSMLDPVIVVPYLWIHGIRARTIYKSEFDRVKIAKWLFSRVGAFPVERGAADMKAVRRARASLMRGEWILIYPEGTRVKSDDEPVVVHGGFSLMAHMGKAGVQPLAIVGARDITKRGKHFHKPGRVFLKVGDLIEFSDLDAKGKKAQIAAMERVAMDRVYALRTELRDEHPGKM